MGPSPDRFGAEVGGIFEGMRSAGALVSALLLAGCDPVWNVDVTVTDDHGAALDGAAVTLTCPGAASPYERATTDAKGRTSFGGVGGPSGPGKFATACTVAASKTGYAPASATPTCTRPAGKGLCATGDVKLALEELPKVPTAAPPPR
jgi:hypothetical protein